MRPVSFSHGNASNQPSTAQGTMNGNATTNGCQTAGQNSASTRDYSMQRWLREKRESPWSAESVDGGSQAEGGQAAQSSGGRTS